MHTEVKTNPDESYVLPGGEAVLASTLALMTGHTQAGCCAHREAMAAKIVSNLNALSQDPLLSPGFQALLWSLCQRWQRQGSTPVLMHAAAVERGLWHSSPQAVQ